MLLKNPKTYIKHLKIFPTPTNYNKYIFYPVFTTQKELIDQLYRLTWYLPKRNGVIITIGGHKFRKIAEIKFEGHFVLWYVGLFTARVDETQTHENDNAML